MKYKIILLVVLVTILAGCSSKPFYVGEGEYCGFSKLVRTDKGMVEKGDTKIVDVSQCGIYKMKECKQSYSVFEIQNKDGTIQRSYQQIIGIENDKCMVHRYVKIEGLKEDNPRYAHYKSIEADETNCLLLDDKGQYMDSNCTI